MFLKNLQKIYYYFLAILDILYFFFELILIVFNLKDKERESKIFFLFEGGFGHTISEPHYLNLTEKKKWLIIIPYEAQSHNKKIFEAFKDHVLLLRKSNIFWKYGLILKKITLNFVKFFYGNKFKYVEDINKYILKKNIKTYKNNYHTLIESITFKEFNKNIHHNLYRDFINENRFQNLLSNFRDYNGLVNFHYRNKGNITKTNDLYSIARDSGNIDLYKKTILNLIEKNWIICFGGDEFKLPHWLNPYKDRITSKESSKLDKNDYGVFCGLTTEVFIGNASGGVMYNLINSKKKSLIINCLPLGYGYINSIASYPLIKFDDKKQFYHLMKNFVSNDFKISSNQLNFQNIVYEKMKVIDEDVFSDGTNLIVNEFFENLSNKEYGISAEELAIDNGILNDTNCKISNKWLELINFKDLK